MKTAITVVFTVALLVGFAAIVNADEATTSPPPEHKHHQKKKHRAEMPAKASEKIEEPVVLPDGTIKISSTVLGLAYEKNEIRADEVLKGHVLEVGGRVDNISRDMLGTMFIMLHSEYTIIANVQCYLGESQKDSVMRISRGQKITIRGRCDGKLVNVLLKDCIILQPEGLERDKQQTKKKGR